MTSSTVSGDCVTGQAREDVCGIDPRPVTVSSEHVERQARRLVFFCAEEELLTKPTKIPKPIKNEDHDRERRDLLHSDIPKWLQEFQKILWMTEFQTHFPKDRNCEICQRTRNTRASCRRRIGGAVFRADFFGDLITADHKVLSEGCELRNNHRYAVVVQDLTTQWNQSYPCNAKTSQETQRSLQMFLEPNRKPKVICTNNSWEFGKACEDLYWNHCASTPHRSETNGIAERDDSSPLTGGERRRGVEIFSVCLADMAGRSNGILNEILIPSYLTSPHHRCWRCFFNVVSKWCKAVSARYGHRGVRLGEARNSGSHAVIKEVDLLFATNRFEMLSSDDDEPLIPSTVPASSRAIRNIVPLVQEEIPVTLLDDWSSTSHNMTTVRSTHRAMTDLDSSDVESLNDYSGRHVSGG